MQLRSIVQLETFIRTYRHMAADIADMAGLTLKPIVRGEILEDAINCAERVLELYAEAQEARVRGDDYAVRDAFQSNIVHLVEELDNLRDLEICMGVMIRMDDADKAVFQFLLPSPRSQDKYNYNLLLEMFNHSTFVDQLIRSSVVKNLGDSEAYMVSVKFRKLVQAAFF